MAIYTGKAFNELTVRGSGTAATDNTNVDAAITALENRGGGTLWIDGTVGITGYHSISAPISIRGVNKDAKLEVSDTSGSTGFNYNSGYDPRTDTTYDLTATSAGDCKFQSVASISRGEWFIAFAENDISGIPTHGASYTYRPMEIHKLNDVATSDYYFDDFFIDPFTTTPKIALPTMLDNVVIADLTVEWVGAARPESDSQFNFLTMVACSNLTIENLHFLTDGPGAINISHCGNVKIQGLTVDGQAGRNSWYGVTVGNSNGVIFCDSLVNGCRHVVSTHGQTQGLVRYGGPRNMVVQNVTGRATTDFAYAANRTHIMFDTHAEGFGTTFRDCLALNSSSDAAATNVSFQSRARATKFINCQSISKTGHVGSSNGLAMRLNGPDSEVIGCHLEGGWRGLEFDTENGTYDNNLVRDCTFVNIRDWAIKQTGGDGQKIVNNKFINCGGTGDALIVFTNGTGHKVLDNSMSKGGNQYAVDIASIVPNNPANIEIVGNVMTGYGSGSVGMDATSDAATADAVFYKQNFADSSFDYDMDPEQLKGRITAGNGRPEDLGVSDLTEELTPAAGDFLIGWESGGALRKFDVGDLPSGGGGEINTASNVGTLGYGVWDAKNVYDLEFRNIAAGSTKVTVTLDDVNNNISVDVDPSVIATSTLNNDANWNNYSHPNHGGDLSGTGDGDYSVAAGAITNAKMADAAAYTVKANATAASGSLQDITAASLTEETAPAAGDFLLGWEAGGALRKFDCGDLHAAVSHSGDVTGTTTLTIGTGTVTNAKLVDMAAWSIKMRNDATLGDPQDGTYTNITTDATPVAGDWLLGFLSTGEIRKFDVDTLPAGTPADNSITNAMLADAPAWSFKIRNAATPGDPSDAVQGNFTEEVSPGSGDWLIGYASTGEIRKFDIGNLPAGTPGDNSITNAKLSDMAAWTVKVRNNAAAGDPEDVTVAGLTEELTPASGDYLLGWESGGTLRKFDVGDLPETYTHPNHGGDLSGTGDGNYSVAANAIDNTKLDDMNSNSLKGRSAGTGDPQDLIYTTVTTEASPASGDWVLGWDNVGALVKYDIGNLPSGTPADNTISNAKLTDVATASIKGRATAATGDPEDLTVASLTEETTPAAGDYLLGWESGGALRKFDVGDLPTGGGGTTGYGSLTTFNASTDQTITADTWTKATGFTTNGPSSNTTVSATNDKITVTNAGDYMISFQASFEGANNSTCEMAIYTGSPVAQSAIGCKRSLDNSGDPGSASGTGIVTLSASDDVELWVKSTGTSFLASYMQLMVHRVS